MHASPSILRRTSASRAPRGFSRAHAPAGRTRCARRSLVTARSRRPARRARPSLSSARGTNRSASVPTSTTVYRPPMGSRRGRCRCSSTASIVTRAASRYWSLVRSTYSRSDPSSIARREIARHRHLRQRVGAEQAALLHALDRVDDGGRCREPAETPAESAPPLRVRVDADDVRMIRGRPRVIRRRRRQSTGTCRRSRSASHAPASRGARRAWRRRATAAESGWSDCRVRRTARAAAGARSNERRKSAMERSRIRRRQIRPRRADRSRAAGRSSCPGAANASCPS